MLHCYLRIHRRLVKILGGALFAIGILGFFATNAKRAKANILSIQEYMVTQTIPLKGSKGTMVLVNLNKHANSSYLLRFFGGQGELRHEFHIESPPTFLQKLSLFTDYAEGIMITDQANTLIKCPLLEAGEPKVLVAALGQQKSYVSLCNGRVFLRNTIEGEQSVKERMVDFLRDEIWGGEAITTLVKDTLYKDKFLLSAKSNIQAQTPTTQGEDSQAPASGQLKPLRSSQSLSPLHLDFSLANVAKGQELTLGAWYELKDQSGAFVSIVRPEDLSLEILNSYPDRVGSLDAVEDEALVYLTAFDMSRFRAGFVLGTEHPRLDWSDRVPWSPGRNLESNLGPDGFDTSSPLQRTGIVPPVDRKHIQATFVGGFKRSHGAFRHDHLASTRNGHHYGFVESGVVYSKLQPHLATLIIDYQGSISIKTWSEADTLANNRVLHARQNGYPILEYDSLKQTGVPNINVIRGIKGNWSADAHSVPRTLRSGACLSQHNGRSFLIYGYFSSVTVNAMARVFQAYHCDVAIHLDMNLLEHTYLARFVHKPGSPYKVAEHLISGMNLIDQRNGGAPRFVGVADVRDFFYLTSK